MKEKNGLDKRFQNFEFNNEIFKESKNRKKMRQKVAEFIQKAFECENFTLKQGEIRSQICWCKKIDKACIFNRCPKNINN